MKKIVEFTLEEPQTTIAVPRGARVLGVGEVPGILMGYSRPVIWLVVSADEGVPTEERAFYAVPTDEEIEDDISGVMMQQYIGTLCDVGGRRHVFEGAVVKDEKSEGAPVES
jgi:hypothetical protein